MFFLTFLGRKRNLSMGSVSGRSRKFKKAPITRKRVSESSEMLREQSLRSIRHGELVLAGFIVDPNSVTSSISTLECCSYGNDVQWWDGYKLRSISLVKCVRLERKWLEVIRRFLSFSGSPKNEWITLEIPLRNLCNEIKSFGTDFPSEWTLFGPQIGFFCFLQVLTEIRGAKLSEPKVIREALWISQNHKLQKITEQRLPKNN